MNHLKRNLIVTTGFITLALSTVGYRSLNSEATPAANTGSPITEQIVAQAKPVRVGQPAPEFTGTDSNGKSHNLKDFRGKTVVLEWTNHDCPFVKKHYESGNMQQLQKDAKGKDVVWLSIVSSAQGQQGFVDGKQANQLTKARNANPTAVILDPKGTIGRLYNARTTPHMFVIDPKGVLQYAGAIDDKPSSNSADVKSATNYVRAAMTSVVSGQPVKTPTTQPYGCSVKYGS